MKNLKNEHREIIAALKSRQGRLAEELLIRHKKQSFDLFSARLLAEGKE